MPREVLADDVFLRKWVPGAPASSGGRLALLGEVSAARLGSHVVHLMFWLLEHFNPERGCYASVPTLVRESGLSERQVQRSLKRLRGSEFLAWKYRRRQTTLMVPLRAGYKKGILSSATGVTACDVRPATGGGSRNLVLSHLKTTTSGIVVGDVGQSRSATGGGSKKLVTWNPNIFGVCERSRDATGGVSRFVDELGTSVKKDGLDPPK